MFDSAIQANLFDANLETRADSLSERLVDKGPGALRSLQAANAVHRTAVWPAPFDHTRHSLHRGDSRDLGWIPDRSIDLVVTSPPYWTLKQYNNHPAQLGDIADYDAFLCELDRVWRECARVLVPGGRICCVVGDVCVSRRANGGRHWVVPLHADIQVRARSLGLDNLTPILWHKIANGAMESARPGSGYYGKPYQPNGVIKNDIEHILFLRKGGQYRKPDHTQKVLSMLTREEQRAWFQQLWADVPGASTRDGHPAPYPAELAYRLIRMFSFAGDTILDPFLGTGVTSVAAIRAGRNSVGCELDERYFRLALRHVSREARLTRSVGAVCAEVEVREGSVPEAQV